MMLSPLSKMNKTNWSHPQAYAALLSVCVIVCTFVACQTVDRTIVIPPNIPGAEFSGSESCEVCHAEIMEAFVTADHARLDVKGEHGTGIACEACHGPSSIHVMEGGGRMGTINPRRSSEVCLNCHLDIRSKTHLPNHHPMGQGQIACVDCHAPHHGNARHPQGQMIAGNGGQCATCHERQAGPFAFEHEASREGCTQCHDPHGSVNAKLLKQRNASLCTQCHIMQRIPTGEVLIGGENHAPWLTRGTCWTAGCHEAVHGSHVSSSLRF